MKSAPLYFSVRCDLSRMTWTLTPRFSASTKALAIGALVNEYAWTKTLFVALSRFSTTASVQPPFGEKKTWMLSAALETSTASESIRALTKHFMALIILENVRRGKNSTTLAPVFDCNMRLIPHLFSRQIPDEMVQTHTKTYRL